MKTINFPYWSSPWLYGLGSIPRANSILYWIESKFYYYNFEIWGGLKTDIFRINLEPYTIKVFRKKILGDPCGWRRIWSLLGIRLYEWLVLQFLLCNALATLMCTMNNVLCNFIDSFSIVYLDDNLVFSETLGMSKCCICSKCLKL
jgi:hypothetical protein